MIITLQTLLFFRESLFKMLDQLLRPYYKRLSLAFTKNDDCEDDESEEQVFADFDDDRGVMFYPPVYLQRYAAVSDCLLDERWRGKLEKVVDLGYHDMSFIKYLKEVQGIKCILGVDIDSIPLSCSLDLLHCEEYTAAKVNPLEVTLFEGNAADPDYRLIGCDAVIAIELIEHMLPHDLERLIHTVFGFIQPQIAVFTTPNGDFNILFKALEKNGLRRLDHFFEWSREQFNDWCSNIVVRYPGYTVTCRGVGPGPVGTKHLGCCSQMALFVANDYQKQQNLNFESLALVPGCSRPTSIANLISSWECLDSPMENNMIEFPTTIESYSELSPLYSNIRSAVTFTLSSSSYSVNTLLHQERASQCNLDTEYGRNYLMFDYEQMYFDIITPRKEIQNRVYEIEDVNSRLNCTTLEVKKFSQRTLNVLAKNTPNPLDHTKEVVSEIENLAKMLNLNKEGHQLNGTHVWCNINWGENAPYWNQYYKVFKQHNYPFETPSEETRILDLITDEISRLIDLQYGEETFNELNKIEIPIQHLMDVVKHITSDVEKVKDLLEWNGYEISDDVVIHSRLPADYFSVETQEDFCLETDANSDWDSTEIRSNNYSDGSTILPDYHARCLHRALDQKVRQLRSILTADEDITTELDHVVCRLMKIALRNCKGRSNPPPTRWLQCKLFDLLTLTEKSIARKKRHIDNRFHSLKAVHYDLQYEEIKKIKDDKTALNIVEEYGILDIDGIEGESGVEYEYRDSELVDDLSGSSSNFVKDYRFIDRVYPSVMAPENNTPDLTPFEPAEEECLESKLERTQAWVEEEVVPYTEKNTDAVKNTTEAVKASATKHNKKKHKNNKTKLHSKTQLHKTEDNTKLITSKSKLLKKVSRKHLNNLGFRTNNKYLSADFNLYRVKIHRKHKALHPTLSKPIPLSLIELCNSGRTMDDNRDIGKIVTVKSSKDNKDVVSAQPGIAASKQSLLIDIITDDTQETIAFRKTVGTDVIYDPTNFEDERLIRSVSNTLLNEDNMFDKQSIVAAKIDSEIIFLYDINEPTTSKGIRQTSMDVQCGPDASAPIYSMLSATTSLSRMPPIFSAAIKIGDSKTDAKIENVECGTHINADNRYKTITPTERSVGIKIKDSDTNLAKRLDFTTLEDSTLSDNNNNSISGIPKPCGLSFYESPNVDEINSLDCSAYSNCIEDIIKFNLHKNISIDFQQSELGSNLAKQSYCLTKIQKSRELCESKKFSSPQTLSPKQSLSNFINFASDTSYQIDCLSKFQEHYESYYDSSQIITNTNPLQFYSKKDEEVSFKESNITKMTESTSSIHETSDKTACQPFKVEDLTLGNSHNDIGTKCPTSIKYIYSSDLNPSEDNEVIEDSGQMYIQYEKPKLCHGGVQVHSYRDKENSEDIIFQGEWQRSRPKRIVRRKVFSPIASKRVMEAYLKKKVSSKEKLHTKSIAKKSLKIEPKHFLKRTINVLNSKSDLNYRNDLKFNEKLSVSKNVTNARKQYPNIPKGPTKLPKSSVPVKPLVKNILLIEKTQKATSPTLTKHGVILQKSPNKDYIPLYLKQKLKVPNKTDSENHLKSNLNILKLNKLLKNISITPSKTEKIKSPLIRSKTEEIKRSLLKFQTHNSIPRYAVFRNELENTQSSVSDQLIKSSSDSAKKRDASKQRTISPSSANSSTASSPCSISTVKAVSNRIRILSNQLHSTSPENTTYDGTNKLPKRSKILKTTPEKPSDNKENIPQTSKQSIIVKTDADKIGHSFLKGKKKDIYVAKLKERPPIQLKALSKNKSQKSNANISKVESISSKTSSLKLSTPSPKIASQVELPSSLNAIKNNDAVEMTQTSDMVLIVEPQERRLPNIVETSRDDNKENAFAKSIVSGSMDAGNKACNINPNDIKYTMEDIINEALEFIDDPKYDVDLIDSETVVLSRENLSVHMDDRSSSISFKTITNDDMANDTFQDEVDFSLNQTFNSTIRDDSVISLNDTGLTVTDLDTCSFKSISSSSRVSDSADNDMTDSRNKVTPKSMSVCDIFERKPLPFQPTQTTPGPLAVQLFSGFSINGDPVPGDQLDGVNLIDSETGSVAVNVARRITSEELFVSGRTSDSFDSTILDEDSVVPNWLFQIISQQQSGIEELQTPEELVIPLPVEALFDDNGNVIEGPAIGAGAGDGCGIHSDPSQDSSGLGTSSSDTSSGPRSEGVLMDPSAYAAQFELLRDAVESSVIVVATSDPEGMEAMANRHGASDTVSYSAGEARRIPRVHLTSASDHDADVSSLDTDPQDSSTD